MQKLVVFITKYPIKIKTVRQMLQIRFNQKMFNVLGKVELFKTDIGRKTLEGYIVILNKLIHHFKYYHKSEEGLGFERPNIYTTLKTLFKNKYKIRNIKLKISLNGKNKSQQNMVYKMLPNIRI